MAGETEPKTLVASILNLGEEKLGELVNLLLANERFVGTVQSTISSGLNAKSTIDKNVERMLGWVNVPTLEDVDQLKAKLDELEEVMAEIGDRVRSINEASLKKAQDAKRSSKKKIKKSS